MSRRSRSPLAVAVLLAAAWAALARAADPPQAPGDPLRGRALFIGAARFQNGGSPCGACHAVGGQGRAFAAGMGPELSRSFEGHGSTDGGLAPHRPALPQHGPGLRGPPAHRAGARRPRGLLRAGDRRSAARARSAVAGYAAAVALACVAGMAVAAAAAEGLDAGPAGRPRTHPWTCRRRAMSWIKDIVEPRRPQLGGVLPEPLPARQGGAQHARRELHRRLLLERPREGRHRDLGDPGARLPAPRAATSPATSRAAASAASRPPGTSTARCG